MSAASDRSRDPTRPRAADGLGSADPAARPASRLSRRALLLGATGAAGLLLVGWGVMPPRSRLGKPALWAVDEGEVALNGWIKVAADGAVVLAMPRSEMGQGVHTALAMLVAEEMDLRLDQVRLEQAGADKIYGNVVMLASGLPIHPKVKASDAPPWTARAADWLVTKVARELGINATGGSSSVADAWEPVRAAAATARAALLGAAAAQWRQPLAELVIEQGVVRHPASGQQAPLGELSRAAVNTPPGVVTLKSHAAFRLVGQAAPRLDIPSKVDGSAVFGIDVRRPGMWFAAVRMCPMLGGSAGALQVDAALKMPGVQRVVRLGSYAGSTAGFAVVADTYWQAEQAAQAVGVDWRAPPGGPVADTESIEASLQAAVAGGDGHVFYRSGDWAAAEQLGEQHPERRLSADYVAPYLAHATLEPMNCTAQVTGDGVELWVPTQVPQLAAGLAARVAGVQPSQVRVHVTALGGGFGRRLDVDVVGQAVRLAMECGGRPVQLIWSREQDFGHDFFRPMQVARLQAVWNDKGEWLGLSARSAGDAITPRWLARTLPALSGPIDTPDKTASEGLFDQSYAIAHQQIAHVATRHRVPVGFWRAVGHSHNAFFIESFVDEVAAALGRDPLAWRQQLLQDAPRHRRVLELAAEKAGWHQPAANGRARGLAMHESFGSVVAVVIELSRGQDAPQIHRVTVAIDCGQVINPATVAQQMEGSVVFALSAALYGRVQLAQGAVQGLNFPAHRMLGMSDAPRVDTHIVASHQPPKGVGEPGVPPVAPALANAWFRLSGERRRRLPLWP